MTLLLKKNLNSCALILLITATQLFAQGPRVSTPTGAQAPQDPSKNIFYPWHKNVTATIFWIGETPTPKNPTPNNASSWDVNWQANYGGFDNPDPSTRTPYFTPKAFTPRQNPFYIALPYNDVVSHRQHKPEASRVIPWFKRYNPKPGKTVCKGRWVQIIHGRRICYAQWEDCGPFNTTDWQYVFGNARPKNNSNKQAGIDVSPAIRDYLKLKSGHTVHWRFIEYRHIPQGPWAKFGDNNPFVNPKLDKDKTDEQRYMEYLRKKRDEAYKNRLNKGR